MEQRRALIIGASGLVGGLCLRELLEEERYAEVLALGRWPLTISHPKLLQSVVDFSRPESWTDAVKAEDVFSCLGTTTAKSASREEYRRIDLGIPLELAKLASSCGAKRFLLVSSVGADAKSSFFYPRLKGELEDSVSKLPFEAAHIFRPSFLLGARKESRPLEGLFLKAAPLFSPFLLGPARKYRAVEAATVARAMIRAALSDAKGVSIHEYDAIRALGL
jgi:uncharacterized protein YbjT (DUF2867 family)